MLRDLRCKCALALNLLFASLSLGQVTDGSASWWDPPSQYIGEFLVDRQSLCSESTIKGACNVPVNAWGPNFIGMSHCLRSHSQAPISVLCIATAIQNWQRGGSGVCGQQIQITSKVNGARLIGKMSAPCLSQSI